MNTPNDILPDAFDWPVLTSYDQQHLMRIALPLGGVGTGTVSLGGRGDLRDWEIVNRPAKGFSPPNSFFALWCKSENQPAVARTLEGPLDPSQYEGAFGATVPNHTLPRFRHARFDAAYPFGQVVLSDENIPLQVRIQAFNPLVPGDSDQSGLPVAVLRFVLTNPTHQPIEAAICGNLCNFIGADGSTDAARDNRNTWRDEANVRGIFMDSQGVDKEAEQWGTIALSTTANDVTYRTAWPRLSWGDALLDFWDDWSDDGCLEERAAGQTLGSGPAPPDLSMQNAPRASVATRFTVPPMSTHAATFLLSWHFPNRQTWTPAPQNASNAELCCMGNECASEDGQSDTLGNFYTTQFDDAWHVAQKVVPQLDSLEAQTRQFVAAFCASDLPHAVREAALFNLSTLRSQTCFRTRDGHFYGWEGCSDKGGCCDGSCTHVWNYEQATAFLFGDLSRDMREIEFAHATEPSGHMNFRVALPLGRKHPDSIAAADGQMGCIMKLHRDWQLSGDEAMLARLWASARRALEFCWIEGGWDADRDGVMEGCQHNTMDVEYFGPNPQMGTWYLGALRAAEAMARHQDQTDFADRCRDMFERGKNWIDANLWNGDYYEHHIVPPRDADAIAPGLRHANMGARDLSDPELQLGAGCLVDQLVGQMMAHVCGLGYLLDANHVQQTLQSIMKFNFKDDLSTHFNHMRSYALGEESALLMASYPRGNRPKRPFPYYNEVMTGFEYTAAVGMLQEGQIENGLKCIESIRARYDGHKRSPFDEAECGHHYARAMTSWAAVLALTGFHYSAVEQRIEFAQATKEREQQFWSNGAAWGTCVQKQAGNEIEVELQVMHGSLAIKKLTIANFGEVKVQGIEAGQTAVFVVTRAT